MRYLVTCPKCSQKNYEYGQGCHNCGAKVGWPDDAPTPEQLHFFARHGLTWIGGSVLQAVSPSPMMVKEGHSFFGLGVDVPGLLSGAFDSGSGVINVTPLGASRGNVIFNSTASVGYMIESGSSRAQSAVRLARYDMPGFVHPFPSDVPGPNDIPISGSSI